MTRNGKWILEYDGDNECDNLYKCSMCGFECGCEEYDKPNFCPNCGTDMRIDDRVTMTREKAIKMLKALNIMLRSPDGKPISDVCDALDIAIEALLEPINCVKCKHYYEIEDDTDVHGRCKMDTAHTELVRCNECKWYQGVHGVQGHAPCEYFNKQVLWNDFCSWGEPYKGGDAE